MTEPHPPIADKLRDLIADFLGVPPAELTPDRKLEEFNVDSFDFIEILYLIEDKTGLEIPASPTELRGKIDCIGDIYRLAEEYAIAANQKQASNG
ncbi:acyl carrier protein [Agrobacterium rhizogenes]|jgi:acyl carrier protein|uniref:Acyl carrier protein n=2 Tax=unclassified Rhizobium TaxID=2613769 RepID=A0AAU7SN62_9HYPH|nr:acyl carrier protein [Rhizobium rhizogenes]NTJ77935.1 acyl carrier protein [Rhizobium rhizogenes]